MSVEPSEFIVYNYNLFFIILSELLYVTAVAFPPYMYNFITLLCFIICADSK